MPDCNPIPDFSFGWSVGGSISGSIGWNPPIPEFQLPAIPTPPMIPPIGYADWTQPPEQHNYPQPQPRPWDYQPAPPASQPWEYPTPIPQPQPRPYQPAPQPMPSDRAPRPVAPEPFPQPTPPADRPPEIAPGIDNGDATIGRFPPRDPNAMSGSRFYREVLGADPTNPKQIGLTGPERDAAILREIESGNIPEFLRNPKTIVVRDAQGNTAEFQVLPDYLAIGSDNDYVRVPMSPGLARAIANKYGFDLPTEKLCRTIYKQPDAVKMIGVGLVNSREDTNYMQGNGFTLRHDSMIDANMPNAPTGTLIAGHKKDIILSNFAAQNPSRMDFYGLYNAYGNAIQGSGGGAHEVDYADYSHGARLVSQRVVVNGVPMSYEQLLKDKRYAHLASSEGPIDTSRVYR